MNRIIWRDIAHFSSVHCAKMEIDLQKGFKNSYCDGADKYMNDWQVAWMEIPKRANKIIADNWSGSDPSPFKQVAATALSIIELAPIPEFLAEQSGFSERFEDFSESPLGITPRVLAAEVAYSYAKAFLEGATIGEYKTEKVIDKPLSPSDHYLTDLLISLALTANGQEPYGTKPKNLCRVNDAFNFVTLVFESLAYGANDWPQLPVEN